MIHSSSDTDRYVSEINKHPVLSREAEQAMAIRYKAGDERAGHGLVTANLRFVVKIAHEYRGYGLNFLDLVQEGNLGLTMAIRKFEPAKGYRLISYAVWWIRAYMQDFILRSWSLVKLGTTHIQRKLFFKLRAARELAARDIRDGRPVTTDELAERLASPRHEVVNMEARLGFRDFSLDSKLEPGSQQSHVDVLPAHIEAPAQDDVVFAHEHLLLVREKLRHAQLLLTDRERFILERRLLADKPELFKNIGAQLGISRERTRQVYMGLLKKLRRVLREVRP